MRLDDRSSSSMRGKLQRTPKEVARAIGYSGFFGVRSVGPVGDFLDYRGYHDGLSTKRGWEHVRKTGWTTWTHRIIQVEHIKMIKTRSPPQKIWGPWCSCWPIIIIVSVAQEASLLVARSSLQVDKPATHLQQKGAMWLLTKHQNIAPEKWMVARRSFPFGFR